MKIISRLITAIVLVATLVLSACQDEEFAPFPSASVPDASGVTRALNATSSLKQNADGTWTANCRVPLVGEGRVVDDIANQLVSAVDLSDKSSMDNLVDTDLTNPAVMGKNVAGVQLIANQIVSVRDLERTYAGGQTVGFTYTMSNPTLLNVDLLKGFWIQTYYKGEKTSDYMVGGSGDTNVLNLNLLSTLNNDGIQSLSFQTTKPFDEVAIGFSGVDADVLAVLGNLELYYFFVGDNEVKPVYNGSAYFPDASLNTKLTSTLLQDYGEKLVDANTSDGVTMELIIKLLGGLGGLFGDTSRMTVNLGKTVEAGTEIGFYMNEVNVLQVGLLDGIEFRTYDEEGNEVERIAVDATGLLGVSAIGGGKSLMGITVKKPCSQIQIRFTGLDLNIGGTTLYYAYVRDAVKPDISSYFSTGDVTINGNSYHLPQPSEGSVSWSLATAPSGSAPSIDLEQNKIIGMTVDGDYVLNGTYTYTDASGQQQSQAVSFTIHRLTASVGDNCNQLIGEALNAEAYIPQGGGSLISTQDVDSIDNVVNDNPNDYATYHKELSIANNIGLIGVRLGEGKEIVASESHPMRVGFTMQTQSTFLGVGALQFFRIVLYKGDAEVDRSVTDANNLISADLIGSQGNKVRMGFTTTKTFDRIELWSSGVLELDLGNAWRVYNAFYEDGSEDGGCSGYDASDACIEMLTTVHGAEINYEETKIGGVATVAGSFNNLSYIIDDDKNSYATISATTLLGGTTVAVKFDKMQPGTQVGFIVSDPAFVLNGIGVLSGTKLEVYNQGVRVGLAGGTTSGEVLGLDLIGYDGKAYVETTPTTEFDEVRIIFPAVLDALDIIRINGAYIRRDTDGDGIPDCAEDEENPTPPVIDFTIDEAKAETEHGCGTSTIRINITRISGGGDEVWNTVVGKGFTLVCYDAFRGGSVRRDVVLDENHGFTLYDMEPGDYYISIRKDGVTLYNGVHAALHPTQTTWKQAPDDTDWNNWNNWTDGAPWTCTNVIIPGNCVRYPELAEADENYCANLHIADGGEIVHTQYLDRYDYAWVEHSLQPGSYYMLSAPLKQMVTGDLFVPARFGGDHSTEAYFTSLTPMTSPESRFTPRVFQRFWSSTAPGKIVGQDGSLQTVEVGVDQTNWTAPFNAVAEPYRPGMGFSVRTDGAATFRFPKTHTQYTYFDAAGHSTGLTEPVVRTTSEIGRLLTDDMTGKADYQVSVNNQKAGNTFVVGNPFLTHIDIAKFLQANPGLSAVTLNDGVSNITISKAEGGVIATEEGYTHIAPMQAFYVTTTTSGTELTVTFTADMQQQMPGYNISRSSASATRALTRSLPTGHNSLRLTATCGGHSSSCLVRISASAADAYRTGEDTKLLVDADMQPAVTVFTTADGQALSIQQRRGGTKIPVGLHLKQKAKVTLALAHAAGDAWSDWVLLDCLTGRRYPLSGSFTYLDLGLVDTQSGRLCLIRK